MSVVLIWVVLVLAATDFEPWLLLGGKKRCC